MNRPLSQSRIAIYARFSSALQNETSAEDQVARCLRYAQAEGGTVDPELVFTDIAVSGASLKRAGFNDLMSAVKAKQVDVILAEDVSRVTRDLADGATLLKELRHLGVQLIGVADGVNSESSGAKLSFAMHALLGEMYLDQLSDKTLRGLEAKARRGLSTGGLPFGYDSEPANDQGGGFAVIIRPEHARIVQRIFSLYASGLSYSAIATKLNEEEAPPPRSRSRSNRKGWIASTIREMLRNEKYRGVWTFKKKQWKKLPGTNTRRYKERDESEVIRDTYEDRRIIDETTWLAVQDRLKAVAEKYSGKGSGAPGKKSAYPFSGILFCADCGAPMSICSGSSANYYRCSDNKKRGNCSNSLSLREDVLRKRILQAIRDHFMTPDALDYLRKKVVEILGVANRGLDEAAREHQLVLARTEKRLANLANAIADGDAPKTLLTAMHDLERQAERERQELKNLEAQTKKAIPLPTHEEVAAYASRLVEIVESDPLGAREALRQLFEEGRLTVRPVITGEKRGRPDGHYVAEGTLLPLVPLLRVQPDKTKKPRESLLRASSVDELSSYGCAGRI